MKHIKSYNESLRDKMTPVSSKIVHEHVLKVIDELADMLIENEVTNNKEEALKFWNLYYEGVFYNTINEPNTPYEIYHSILGEIETYFKK